MPHILGHKVENYPNLYNPSVLESIPRQLGRSKLKTQSFQGLDLWHCYEFSYLDMQGLPQCYVLSLSIAVDSKNLVESKSLKLYLFSFSQTKFKCLNDVLTRIHDDLEAILEGKIVVEAYRLEQAELGITLAHNDLQLCGYSCLDSLELTQALRDGDYNYHAFSEYKDEIYEQQEHKGQYKIYSNSFVSLCPVTSQPDFATIFIDYQGYELKAQTLLRYLISYRKHLSFHENCVEQIFDDLLPFVDELSVGAKFTRRGGIDINPYRSTQNTAPLVIRTSRQ